MENSIKTPIIIGKDKDPYEMPLNLKMMATNLRYLFPNSKRDLEDVYQSIGLDPATRRKQSNTPRTIDPNECSNMLSINKGLTMELFAGGMFSYIDHPVEVHANCNVTRHLSFGADGEEVYQALPNNFAQSGVPDVLVDYPDFKVMLEVSAKSKPPLEHFKSQLRGAVKHARMMRESGDKKPIYCLLVNFRSLIQSENKEALKEVLNDVDADEEIYITAVSIAEFSDLGRKMAGIYESNISKISSKDLLGILSATIEKGINGQFHVLFMEYLEKINPTNSPRTVGLTKPLEW